MSETSNPVDSIHDLGGVLGWLLESALEYLSHPPAKKVL